MSIRDWPDGERPREKLRMRGSGSLSDAELLAVFIGSGRRGSSAVDMGRELLSGRGGLKPDNPRWWFQIGFVLIVLGAILTFTGAGGSGGGSGSGSGGGSDSGSWWDSGSGSSDSGGGDDSGSWWDDSSSDSGSWDDGGSDSGSWDDSSSDSGSWDDSSSDSGSW